MSSKRKQRSVTLEDLFLRIKGIISLSDKDNDSKADMIEELEEVVMKAESIIDVLAVRPSAFSEIKYKHMKDKFGFDVPDDTDDLPEWNPPFALPPKKWLQDISERLRLKSIVVGPHTTVSNESQTKFFIDPFVDTLLLSLKGTVVNAAEEKISSRGSQFSGQIEYILRAFKECIIVIIEAKKNVVESNNYGQIMVQLHAIYRYNEVDNKKPLSAVYGVLSDSRNWRWWKYDGKTFMVSKRSELKRADKTSVGYIAGTLYAIIINAYIESYRVTHKGDTLFREFDLIIAARNNEEAEDAISSLINNIPMEDISKGQAWEIDYDELVKSVIGDKSSSKVTD